MNDARPKKKTRVILGAVAGLAGAALLLYFAAEDPPPVPINVAEASPAPAVEEEPAPAPSVPAAPPRSAPKVIEPEEDKPQKLDPKSEDFFERVDVAIPRHLFARAAECDTTGAEKNEKLRLQVRVRALNDTISVLEANILHSTIVNKTIETCLRDAVKNATWTDEEMPDWEDEDEILIRIKGLKKHRPVDEDEDSEEE